MPANFIIEKFQAEVEYKIAYFKKWQEIIPKGLPGFSTDQFTLLNWEKLSKALKKTAELELPKKVGWLDWLRLKGAKLFLKSFSLFAGNNAILINRQKRLIIELLKQDEIKKSICVSMVENKNDIFEISRLVTSVLIKFAQEKKIKIPLDPYFFANCTFLLDQVKLENYCLNKDCLNLLT